MSTYEASAGFYRGTTKSYEIPVDHLDYKFIEKCTDVKHLEKILSILSPEIINFLTDIKLKEQQKSVLEKIVDNLPPIRSVSSNPTPNKPRGREHRAGNSKVPREYGDWDRLDIEKELSKIDETAEKSDQSKTVINTTAAAIKKSIDVPGLSMEQKSLLAQREKEKGNEAFRSGDYEEAISYYSRSLSVLPSTAAYNNRAQAEIKLKNWQNAFNDCERVLDLEPNNMKALLRRATVNKNLHNYQAALNDLKTVLHQEPDNPLAKKALCEVEELLHKEEEEKTKKGRRIIIEDVDVSEEDQENPIVGKEAGVTVGGETAGELTEMGNAQKKFPKRPFEKKEEADQTPKHNRANNQNGVKSDNGNVRANNPSEQKTKPGQSSTQAPAGEVTSRTGNQEAKLSTETLSPSARMKAEGNQLFKNGQFGEAAIKYSEAIENIKNTGAEDAEELGILYSNRAACHLKDGNSLQCIEDCNKALELQPFSIKPLLRRAMAYESLERYRQAYVDYKVALQIDSGTQLANDSINRITKTLIDLDGPSWREKLPPIPSVPVATQIQMQEKATANAKTSKNIRVASDTGKSAQERFQALKQEGNDCVKKSHYREAVSKYTECLQINPEECTIYTNRALCYLKLCQYEEARHDCDCALQQDASNIKALYRRAQAYKGLESYQDCASDLQKVISLDPAVMEAKNLLEEITPFLSNRLKANKSDKQRKKIPIKEVNEEKEDPSSHSSLNGHGNRVRRDRPAITKPSNAYEFEQQMIEIRAEKDQERCAQLLSLMDPKDLTTFLSNKLDTETLLLMTQSMKHHILEENPTLVYQHLSHLSTADRFTVTVSLLSQTEKDEVQSVLDCLAKKLDPNAISSLAQQYRL
ncbi:PREDICTED: sperm-associated antigen 1 [Nanorana parkeri]|uniref:sperm-associated antigen 1 n=1 Tax=Nanorana parkeri TaxID=125878 RepID=UPI000854A514|nr:PREDICTED: sperm-associated antigen 1 [Nanorana parkeri]